MTTGQTELAARVKELCETEGVRLWEEICLAESPTGDKAGVDAAAAILIRRAQRRGWRVEVREEPVAGSPVCIVLNPDATAKPPIALSGHLDTVHPVGLFGTPAVRVVPKEDRIYGPGVTDCKGGVVAAQMAMEALDDCGFRDRQILLLLQTDEEVSSRISQRRTIRFICERAKDCAAFFNLEERIKGLATVGRKGILRTRFEITGVSVHSSECATGSSAVKEAAYKILELEKEQDPAGLTYNCGTISGGTVANVVPGNCRFELDVRYSDAKQLEEAEKTIARVAETAYVPGTKTTVTEVSRRAAMECVPRNLDLLDRVNGILTDAGMEPLKPNKRKGGSDAADVTAYGIPCLDSLGVSGGRIHSAEEYGILSSLAESALLLATAAKNL